MNRFERLFFILERNPEDSWLGSKEVRGMVKIILTADRIRILWELSGLPMEVDCQYALGIFMKKTASDELEPKYFPIQPNQQGNARTETTFLYKLQEGETVFGVGLSVLLKHTQRQRRFPLVAFQNMRSPWRNMLQKLIANDMHTKESSTGETERLKSTRKATPTLEPEKMQNDTISKAERFGKEFTVCDPFGTTNSAYRWWRNTDMHRLNQVLVELDLTLPLELNKEGYLACGLFGHVLLGLYSDGTLHREFFILGIPAKDKSGSGNYYSNSRWETIGAQVVPEQEETGYWLTYLDCNTGKVVKVV